jgi:hypothetical protein
MPFIMLERYRRFGEIVAFVFREEENGGAISPLHHMSSSQGQLYLTLHLDTLLLRAMPTFRRWGAIFSTRSLGIDPRRLHGQFAVDENFPLICSIFPCYSLFHHCSIRICHRPLTWAGSTLAHPQPLSWDRRHWASTWLITEWVTLIWLFHKIVGVRMWG